MDNEVKKPAAVFEPAKPGDILPEGIWIPNRAERRALKKMKNYKGQDTKLDEYIDLAQKTTKSDRPMASLQGCVNPCHLCDLSFLCQSYKNKSCKYAPIIKSS